MENDEYTEVNQRLSMARQENQMMRQKAPLSHQSLQRQELEVVSRYEQMSRDQEATMVHDYYYSVSKMLR